jgi:tRNA (uracil-5-)-methyltransferase TRM9
VLYASARMDAPTRKLLLDLNRDFYERQAASFSATRDHPWPGWQRVLDQLPSGRRSVLDAGCGNGRFAHFLFDGRGDEAGIDGSEIDYVGIDESRKMIEAARARTELIGPPGSLRFEHADLLAADSLPAGPFDLIVLFGVLHHVPGFETRTRLLCDLASRLAPDGRLACTVWRFGQDPRVVGRTRPFAEHGIAIDPDALEPGDHLLRWGDSEDIVRYCHFADDAEIDRLIEHTRQSGLEPGERFRSDGKSGELNEYVVWSRRVG